MQISFQDGDAESANRIGHHASGHARELAAARLVRAHGLALAVNASVQRQNLDHALEIITLPPDGQRLEIAKVQCYGRGL